MRYIARITDCGPLSFRSGRESARASTLGYVPGSALLGGLAEAHSLLRHNTNEFNAFFMSPQSHFGNLYPATFDEDDLQDSGSPVYPLPLTAMSCKRFGGFQFDQSDQDDPHHGVFDSLIAWTLFSLSGQSNYSALQKLKECPVCGEPLDRFKGFYRRSPFDADKMGSSKAKRELHTRTSINRTTGTVQQGILYSREALKAGTTFWGTLTVPDEYAEAFYEFVEQSSAGRMLRLGNNRTRGFGWAVLSLDEWEDQETVDDLRDRIQTFDRELRQQAQTFGVRTPHALYVPLTLTSDVILPDRLLRYRTAITPDYLAEAWGITGAELIYQNSGLRRVMGWSELWRLPKPDEIAITMGSVFLLGLTSPLDDGLVQKLLQMQEKGIGSRRREGFGQVRVADPFHWEVKGQ